MFGIPIPTFDVTSLLSSLFSGLGNLVISMLNWLWQEAISVINWLISLIPSLPIWPSGIDLGTSWTYILSTLAQELQAWNYYICINLWLYLFGLAMIFEAASATFKALRWLISHLPFVGGEG